MIENILVEFMRSNSEDQGCGVEAHSCALRIRRSLTVYSVLVAGLFLGGCVDDKSIPETPRPAPAPRGKSAARGDQRVGQADERPKGPVGYAIVQFSSDGDSALIERTEEGGWRVKHSVRRWVKRPAGLDHVNEKDLVTITYPPQETLLSKDTLAIEMRGRTALVRLRIDEEMLVAQERWTIPSGGDAHLDTVAKNETAAIDALAKVQKEPSMDKKSQMYKNIAEKGDVSTLLFVNSGYNLIDADTKDGARIVIAEAIAGIASRRSTPIYVRRYATRLVLSVSVSTAAAEHQRNVAILKALVMGFSRHVGSFERDFQYETQVLGWVDELARHLPEEREILDLLSKDVDRYKKLLLKVQDEDIRSSLEQIERLKRYIER